MKTINSFPTSDSIIKDTSTTGKRGKSTNEYSNSSVKKTKTEKGDLKCDICGKCFTLKRNLIRHLNLHTTTKITCQFCGKKFGRRDNLKHHVRKFHENLDKHHVKTFHENLDKHHVKTFHENLDLNMKIPVLLRVVEISTR